jgi:hypothetical protein
MDWLTILEDAFAAFEQEQLDLKVQMHLAGFKLR